MSKPDVAPERRRCRSCGRPLEQPKKRRDNKKLVGSDTGHCVTCALLREARSYRY